MTRTGSAHTAVCEQLAERGWALLHEVPFLVGDRYDASRVLDVAARFGVPSARDGGRPVWPVRPVAAGATFSTASGAAPLHTDAQYHREPEDLVCLFVVRPACDGGLTTLLTVDDAVATLRSHPGGPQIVSELRRPRWSWIAPAVFGATTLPATRALTGTGRLRWRLDNLAPAIGTRLLRMASVVQARIQAAPGLIQVEQRPGDVLVIDNRRVLHGRTAFTDPRRLLARVRLWSRW